MTGLTGAAAAALGVQPPSPVPERLVWVDVEDAPRMIAVLDPTDGMPLGHYAQFDEALPLTDQMAERGRAACDSVDSTSCEADGCSGGTDGSPVGWLLSGDADEETRWTPFALVQRGREVIVVCDDCSPTAVYQRLWSE